MKKLTVSQAVSAARGAIRNTGVDPMICEAEYAWNVLSEQPSDSLASDFYFYASDGQYRTFCREWRKWLAEQTRRISR